MPKSFGFSIRHIYTLLIFIFRLRISILSDFFIFFNVVSKIERMINKLLGIIDCVLISLLDSLICTREVPLRSTEQD